MSMQPLIVCLPTALPKSNSAATEKAAKRLRGWPWGRQAASTQPVPERAKSLLKDSVGSLQVACVINRFNATTVQTGSRNDGAKSVSSLSKFLHALRVSFVIKGPDRLDQISFQEIHGGVIEQEGRLLPCLFKQSTQSKFHFPQKKIEAFSTLKLLLMRFLDASRLDLVILVLGDPDRRKDGNYRAKSLYPSRRVIALPWQCKEAIHKHSDNGAEHQKLEDIRQREPDVKLTIHKWLLAIKKYASLPAVTPPVHGGAL